MTTTETNALALLLQPLASIAGSNSLSNQTMLPTGWDLVTVFPAPGNSPKPFPVVQGFLAQGQAPGGDAMIAVLALGINWTNYQLNYSIGKKSVSTQVQLSQKTTMGGTLIPVQGTVDESTINSYLAKRADIWNALQQLSSLPLYICGMSLGAPIAQLAALDLRPGNTGPGGQDAPRIQPPGFYFSAGNFVNKSFADAYNNASTGIVNQFTFAVNKPGLIIDFFPTAPFDDEYAKPLGSPQSIPAKIPAFDEPWWERGNIFYQQSLGGSPDELPSQPGNISNPPAGYDQTLAYTLATLCNAAYQSAQHPSSVLQGIGNYTLVNTVNSNGSPFAFIFTNNFDAIVLAFRGSITCDEFDSFVASSYNAAVPFDTNASAHMRQGPYNLYYASSSGAPNTATFAQAIKTALTPLLTGGKKLYITGHCLGGAMANLAAADYVMTAGSGITPTAIYTFGATMLADLTFSDDINAVLAAKTYQVVRQKDKIANAVTLLGFFPLQNQLTLTGQMELEELTYHSLTGYITLLNPSSTVSGVTDGEQQSSLY